MLRFLENLLEKIQSKSKSHLGKCIGGLRLNDFAANRTFMLNKMLKIFRQYYCSGCNSTGKPLFNPFLCKTTILFQKVAGRIS